MTKMKFLTFVFALLFALPAVSREKVPVDSALNASLKEKDQVQKTYKKANTSRREAKAKSAREENRRIKLEVGDEMGAIGGGGGGGGGSEEAFSFRSKSRDDDVSQAPNVEQEMKEINNVVGKEMKRGLDSEAGDAPAAVTAEGSKPKQ